MSSGAYAIPSSPYRNNKPMKLTLTQRFAHWLLNDNRNKISEDVGMIEPSRFNSNGIRLQIYKASGGYVVETNGYDRKSDRHNTSIHVITDDQELGNELSKIVVMEAIKS